MKDKYQIAIEYLTEHPEEIADAWNEPEDHAAGCLFQFAGDQQFAGRFECGCLTMIRNSSTFVAQTASLTAAIKADDRIPIISCPTALVVGDLPILAEWQRRLDKELNRA